jgi:hypothetical protein
MGQLREKEQKIYEIWETLKSNTYKEIQVSYDPIEGLGKKEVLKCEKYIWLMVHF